MTSTFYLRVYLGGPRGDFDEVSFDGGDGRVASANRAPRGKSVLRRSAVVSPAVIAYLVDSVRASGLLDADDADWPPPGGGAGVTEVEARLDGVHLSLATTAGANAGDDPALAAFLEVAADARALARTLLAAKERDGAA